MLKASVFDVRWLQEADTELRLHILWYLSQYYQYLSWLYTWKTI